MGLLSFKNQDFWINGEFKYYVAMKKAADKVFSESKIYGSILKNLEVFTHGFKRCETNGEKSIGFISKMNKYSQPPLYLRIDFSCCRDNTMDGHIS